MTEPLERVAAGTVLFASTGWAAIEVLSESRFAPVEQLELHFLHRNSFEAESWLDSPHAPTVPACVMSAGYATGWCTEAFGIELATTEGLCRATSAHHCRFVMTSPEHIADRTKEVREALRPGENDTPSLRPRFMSRAETELALARARQPLEVRAAQRTEELEDS